MKKLIFIFIFLLIVTGCNISTPKKGLLKIINNTSKLNNYKLVINHNVSSLDDINTETTQSVSYIDFETKVTKLSIKNNDEIELNYYIDFSNNKKEIIYFHDFETGNWIKNEKEATQNDKDNILQIIKKGELKKHLDGYYEVKININEFKEISNSNDEIGDVVAKIYTNNEYILKIELENISDLLKKEQRISYEYYSHNKLSRVTIPKYVKNEPPQNIIDQSRYNIIKIRVETFINDLDKLILLQQINGGKKILDENNNIILENLNISTKPEYINLSYVNNKVSGNITWEGYNFIVLENKIIE